MASYGIDIGTSSCKLSRYNGKDCEILTLTDGVTSYYGNDRMMLSAAYLDGDSGEMLVGQDAYNKRMFHPEWYAQEFKRHFGEETPLIYTDTQSVKVERIYEEVLLCMKGRMGSEAVTEEVTLTHPAAYTEQQINTLRNIAMNVGFMNVKTIDEPKAAIEYHMNTRKEKTEGENILAYDLGGGTFDAALVRAEREGYRHLCASEGLERCGGADVDRIIREDIKRKMRASGEIDTETALKNRKFLQLLEKTAVEVKHRLSRSEKVEEPIMVGFDTFAYQITREELNAQVRPLLERTLEVCARMIRMAGLQPKQIHKIVLVGGASQMPLVREMLSAAYPLAKISESGNAEFLVCCGAAMQGGQQNVDIDENTPLETVKRAAKNNLAAAQYELGRRYDNGEGVGKDEREAFRWYMKAAEQGFAAAQNNVGWGYQNGVGVGKDEREAFRWFMKAAEQGLAVAQNNVGWDYQNGVGVGKDEREAFRWYKMAAEQG